MNLRPHASKIATGLLVILVGFILYLALSSCAAAKRAGYVSGGAAVGAGAGFLVGGPFGAVAGAALGGGSTNALVEADASSDREAQYAHVGPYAVPSQPPAPRGPWSWLGIAWWWWAIAAYFAYLRRAHIMDLIGKKGGRTNAVLRMVGIRTHYSPTGGGAP